MGAPEKRTMFRLLLVALCTVAALASDPASEVVPEFNVDFEQLETTVAATQSGSVSFGAALPVSSGSGIAPVSSGSGVPVAPASSAPSSAPRVCTDFVPPGEAAWNDRDGPYYNCAWYTSGANYCRYYGNSYANFGKTANQACCGCGGGIR